jgi:hypothetical protein
MGAELELSDPGVVEMAAYCDCKPIVIRVFITHI